MSSKKKSAEVTAPAVAEVVEPVAAMYHTFWIKKGKAVVGKRGVIGEGEEIKISDVNSGLEGLRALYEKGYIEVVE